MVGRCDRRGARPAGEPVLSASEGGCAALARDVPLESDPWLLSQESRPVPFFWSLFLVLGSGSLGLSRDIDICNLTLSGRLFIMIRRPRFHRSVGDPNR